MSDRHADFCRAHPDVHADVRERFPAFDYRHPAGERSVICDMRNPGNHVGFQQWAFTCWWAIETCGPMDLGLNFGSRKGITPYCVSVDLHGNGRPHPSYEGVYFADIVSDASEATKLCPPGGVPFINACHSLEHMPVRGDAGVQELLRPGGIMALVMPDNDHFDAMACDSDHKHAWGHSDFSRRVLDPLFFRVGLELVEYDTFDNHHSFNVVLRKLDDHQSEAK